MTHTEREIAEIITDAIHENNDDATARSFADAGVFTSNEGIVVRYPGGETYQITIVRSA